MSDSKSEVSVPIGSFCQHMELAFATQQVTPDLVITSAIRVLTQVRLIVLRLPSIHDHAVECEADAQCIHFQCND